MTDGPGHFQVVRRGYRPEEVDLRIRELVEAADSAREHARELQARLEQLGTDEAGPATADGSPNALSFSHLGEHVGQILALAEEEADWIRECAREEATALRARAEQAATEARQEAESYAQERRRSAEDVAARILADSRQLAEETHDAAQRRAAARLEEAEAVHEDQLARAAQSAAEFEKALARRREGTDLELAWRMADGEQRLAELNRHIETSRAAAEAAQADAIRESRQMVDEAVRQAAFIISHAESVAARIRADSERELEAARQRRDSINIQLAGVRQTLATLTGAEPTALTERDLVGQGTAEPDGDDVEEAFLPFTPPRIG